VDEEELLSKVLGFRTLEKDIIVKYEQATFEEKKEKLLTSWNEIKKEINKNCLEFEENPPIHELNRMIKSIIIYSTIYADLINKEALKLHEFTERLKNKKLLPRLKEECKTKIHKKVFGERKAPEKGIEYKHYYKKAIEIDPQIYDEAKNYFFERIEKEVPTLVMSREIYRILEEIVKKNIEKILEVSFRNACRAATYGYVKETPEEIYKVVIEDMKSSIDWMIKHGIIEEEVIPKIKKYSRSP